MWKKTLYCVLAGLLAMLLLSAGIPCSAVQAKAEEEVTGDNGIVDYVLILDCTRRASESDKDEHTRKAAAKLFVDLLPIDNVRVAVFKIGQDSTAPYTDSYTLRADDGHIAPEKADYSTRF